MTKAQLEHKIPLSVNLSTSSHMADTKPRPHTNQKDKITSHYHPQPNELELHFLRQYSLIYQFSSISLSEDMLC